MEKRRKKSSKQKWKNRDYHVQHDKYVDHQDVKISCAPNQFPELKLLGKHNKPHGVIGLGNHYHMRFNTKLGYGTCDVYSIPFACPPCTYMIVQPWTPSVLEHQQPRYKSVKYYTYWPVLGYFKKWNIFQLSHKSTSYE